MGVLLAALFAVALAPVQMDWATHGFTYENTRHAPIAQIAPGNVAQLSRVWRFSTGAQARMESTPIVVGRTMYITTGAGNNVIALDALTGKQKWRYDPRLGTAAACCGLINRGVAVANGRVFLATLDGRLIALNSQNGKPVWDVHVGYASQGFSETMAPLAWNGAVYIGSSGGEMGIRGSFSAYRASDGKLIWRWYSVGPGWEGSYVTSVHGFPLHRDIAKEKRDAARYRDAWKHGGGPVWMTPALDPKTGTLFVSTGNPGPTYVGAVRPGDNLYTDSVVALDARTGKMRWAYQETPHDVWDYDAASPPILFDALDRSGKRVPAVGEAGKSGWLYILDRRTGKLIRLSENLVPVSHIYADPAKEGNLEQPGGLGGVIGPLSYNPAHHFVYVMALDRPEYRNEDVAPPTWAPSIKRYELGHMVPVGYYRDILAAVNVDTGKIAWRRVVKTGPIGEYGGRVLTGTLSAGDLVFASDPDGHFYAFDAATGEPKWTYQIGEDDTAHSLVARIIDWAHWAKRTLLRQDDPPPPAARVDAAPIAYAIDGREYIAIGAFMTPKSAGGNAAVAAFALPDIPSVAQVSAQWPTYGLTLANTRYAAVTQITPRNASQLVKAWRYQLGGHGRMEGTPIVVGSTMYVTSGPGNNVVALDVLTGKQKWRYNPKLGYAAACCGWINRGVAVANGRVFLATLDARLIALNAQNGKPLWNVRIGNPKDGLSETAAPLAWDGIVFVGSSSGDFRVRGSFTAYRASDGKQLWRWYTVGPGWEGKYTPTANGYRLPRDIAKEKRDAAKYRNSWRRGGGAVWMTPALDPKTGTIYLGTGNPAPYYDGSVRPGDNLYTDSVVALDARTGSMRWYYQETPHDLWDYDAASPPVLFDAVDASGKRVPAVGEAGKVGWLYVLDRRSGKLIRRSQSIVPNQHLYADTRKDGALEQPGGLGGVVAPLSYDPNRHLAYIVALDRPEYRHQRQIHETWDAQNGMFQAGDTTPAGSWSNFIVAVNVDTGKIVWRKTMAAGPIAGHFGGRILGGSLSAGNVVFAADPDGDLYAFDAATGKTVWHYRIGADEHRSIVTSFVDWALWAKHALLREGNGPASPARVDASPIVYVADGREYVAIGADITPASKAGGSTITVFALPKP